MAKHLRRRGWSIKQYIAGGIALLVTMPQTVCVEPHRQRDKDDEAVEFREGTVLEAPFRFAVGTSRDTPVPTSCLKGSNSKATARAP